MKGCSLDIFDIAGLAIACILGLIFLVFIAAFILPLFLVLLAAPIIFICLL